MSTALWIRRGEVVEVEAGQRHVSAIVSSPTTFGFSRDSVLAEFNAEREPVGYDGRAANNLEVDMIRRGWIRVRELRNSVAVVANSTRSLDSETLDYLRTRFSDNQLSFVLRTGESWQEWRGRRIATN